MAPAESKNTALSAIIPSLLSAFDSSRQLFHRIKINARQQSSTKSKLGRKHPQAQYSACEGETQARSEQIQLQHARQQIAKTYERNSGRYGERYRHGDDRAKASLNHTLLVLNTGLTKIISSLLHQETNNNNITVRHEARKSLLSLSEKSARDALMELEGLRMRLESASSLSVPMQQQRRQRRNYRRSEEDKQSQKGIQSTAKTRQMEQEKNVKKIIASGRKIVNTPKSTTSRQSITTVKTINGKKQPNHPVWVRSKKSSTIALDTRPTYKHANSSGDTTIKRPSNKPQRPAIAPSSSSNSISPPSLQEQDHHQHPTAQQPLMTTNNRLSILSQSSGSTKLGEIPQIQMDKSVDSACGG